MWAGRQEVLDSNLTRLSYETRELALGKLGLPICKRDVEMTQLAFLMVMVTEMGRAFNTGKSAISVAIII